MTSFRSMGCQIMVADGAPVDDLRRLFDARDQRFSRFLEASELNRINATPSGVAVVSEELASMLSLALDAARATEGLVTPAVGGAMLAAGYDRDYSLISPDGAAVEPVAVPPVSCITLRGRVLLRVEPVILDLNGVVKGKTVDDALELIGEGWVSAGGDLATTYPIVVGLPGGDVVTLERGGLATSSVANRAWLRGGERQHHLIDAATGAPAWTPWQDVTVAAPTCLIADVAAKAALLLGDAGPSWLDERRFAGRFVDHEGVVTTNESWARRRPARSCGMTSLTWYVARSAGIVAYLLLSTSVVLGVLMSARARFTWPRFAVQEVHRFLAILTGVFLALHGIALLADRVVPISVVQLVIPFRTAYRPFGVGLGITSALLLLAVALSNLVRTRLPFRLWRRIHYVTIAVWLTATAHGLLAGTDRQDFWFIALVGAAVGTIGLAFLGRFASTVGLGAVGGVAATAIVAVLGLAFAPQPKAPHKSTATVAAPARDRSHGVLGHRRGADRERRLLARALGGRPCRRSRSSGRPARRPGPGPADVARSQLPDGGVVPRHGVGARLRRPPRLLRLARGSHLVVDRRGPHGDGPSRPRLGRGIGFRRPVLRAQEDPMPIEAGKIRNVAVVGHRGTGKTSLVEALLYQSAQDEPARDDRGGDDGLGLGRGRAAASDVALRLALLV